jgi:anti-sigma regulatory factor (Ser/Thr protein kinase)
MVFILMADQKAIALFRAKIFLIVRELKSDDSLVARVSSVVSELITFIEESVSGMAFVCDEVL